jgi:hypothetical protein
MCENYSYETKFSVNDEKKRETDWRVTSGKLSVTLRSLSRLWTSWLARSNRRIRRERRSHAETAVVELQARNIMRYTYVGHVCICGMDDVMSVSSFSPLHTCKATIFPSLTIKEFTYHAHSHIARASFHVLKFAVPRPCLLQQLKVSYTVSSLMI